MLQLNRVPQGGGVRVDVRGDLTVDHAAEARDGLLAALAGLAADTEVELDLSATERFDAAGLQLLLAAKRALGDRLRLGNHAPAVVELFELYRVAGLFGDPLVLPVAGGGGR